MARRGNREKKTIFASLENIFALKIEFPNSNSPIIFFSLSLRKHFMYCGGETNTNSKYTRLVESYASYLNSELMNDAFRGERIASSNESKN